MAPAVAVESIAGVHQLNQFLNESNPLEFTINFHYNFCIPDHKHKPHSSKLI